MPSTTSILILLTYTCKELFDTTPLLLRYTNSFAQILHKQGLYDQAIREYKESLRLNPNQKEVSDLISRLELRYGVKDTLQSIRIVTSSFDKPIKDIIKDKPEPITGSAIDILLQAYNAGPGAVVVYNGNVVYSETQKYVNKVNYWKSNGVTNARYDRLIQKYAQKYELDINLVKAMIKVESDFRPNAISKAGARGLIQITRVTWNDTIDRLGVNWDYDTNVYDPEKNIIVGCHYLGWLQNRYLPKFFDQVFA